MYSLRLAKQPGKKRKKIIEVISKGEVMATIFSTRKGIKIISKHIPDTLEEIAAIKLIQFDFKKYPPECNIDLKSAVDLGVEKEIEQIEERAKQRGEN